MAKTKQQVRDDINNELHGADIESLMQSMGLKLPSFKRMFAEGVVAFIYGYTIGTVLGNLLVAVSLLMMPAWITLVAWIFITVGAVYFMLATATPVVQFVCNNGEVAIDFAKAKFSNARTWFAARKEGALVH